MFCIHYEVGAKFYRPIKSSLPIRHYVQILIFRLGFYGIAVSWDMCYRNSPLQCKLKSKQAKMSQNCHSNLIYLKSVSWQKSLDTEDCNESKRITRTQLNSWIDRTFKEINYINLCHWLISSHFPHNIS